MSRYEYTVIIEPAKEGGYLARVPALDYLTTEGETIEEARAMAADAIKGYLETLKAQNLPIPQDFYQRAPTCSKVSRFSVDVSTASHRYAETNHTARAGFVTRVLAHQVIPRGITGWELHPPQKTQRIVIHQEEDAIPVWFLRMR